MTCRILPAGARLAETRRRSATPDMVPAWFTLGACKAVLALRIRVGYFEFVLGTRVARAGFVSPAAFQLTAFRTRTATCALGFDGTSCGFIFPFRTRVTFARRSRGTPAASIVPRRARGRRVRNPYGPFDVFATTRHIIAFAGVFTIAAHSLPLAAVPAVLHE